MKYKYLIFTVLVFTSIAVNAQGYKINIEWNGLRDTSLYLAHYFDSKIYVNDTITLDSKGTGTFSGDKDLRQGLYILYLNENSFLDFLVGKDQTFSIKVDNANPFSSLEISDAEESIKFKEYQQFLSDLQKDQKAYNDSLQSATDERKEFFNKKLTILDQKFDEYFKDAINYDESSMFHLFLNAIRKFEIPEPPFEKDTPSYDSLCWFYNYNYKRDHYLDGIDLADERILYTPLLKQKFETYFNKILLQIPDTIIKQSHVLLKQAEKNEMMFQYMSQFLLNNSQTSMVMGMDAVFVDIAENVYLSGKATWADTTTMKKIKEEVFLTKPNLIGKKAPELIMESNTGNFESLHQLTAKYTILIFWEPNCGHCKKEVPTIYNDVFVPFMDQDIQVLAVNIDDDKEEWDKFIEEHELAGWLHVWDPSNSTGFRYKYNVKSTPLVYLLDKDKKIIAKRIDSKGLALLLGSLVNK